MKDAIAGLIGEALRRAIVNGELVMSEIPGIVVEEPKDKKLGDFSTTVAMGLARKVRKSPQVIAEIICKHLQDIESDIESVETAGPGYINIKVTRYFFLSRLLGAAESGDRFGSSEVGKKQKVHLEFVSANPTGPLHVGHGRGAAVGHSLGLVLKKAGYDVHTEYYINDVGNQMNTLGRSTLYRYWELMGKTTTAVFPENHYVGEYIKDIAREIIKNHDDEFLDKPESEVLGFFRKYSSDFILNGIKEDLKGFRVEYESWFSEQNLHTDGLVQKGIDWLKEKGFVYELDGAVWLKSSAFNDDKDRVIVKQNGDMTYFCADIAYHQDKVRRGFQKIIDIWGADHHGYVPRMRAVMEALGHKPDDFNILLVQFVTLKRGDEKVSMSTRSGEFITLKEVVSEVGVDATRFFFLMRSSDTHLDFDLELAKKETPENPVFYIQYAYARICSIFQTAREKGVSIPHFSQIDLALLSSDDDFELIRKFLLFPDVVEKCALSFEVYPIPYYLQELVSIFHGYYKKHRIVTDDLPLTQARLFLLDLVRMAIRNGLQLLGVTAPEKM